MAAPQNEKSTHLHHLLRWIMVGNWPSNSVSVRSWSTKRPKQIGMLFLSFMRPNNILSMVQMSHLHSFETTTENAFCIRCHKIIIVKREKIYASHRENADRVRDRMTHTLHRLSHYWRASNNTYSTFNSSLQKHTKLITIIIVTTIMIFIRRKRKDKSNMIITGVRWFRLSAHIIITSISVQLFLDLCLSMTIWTSQWNILSSSFSSSSYFCFFWVCRAECVCCTC